MHGIARFGSATGSAVTHGAISVGATATKIPTANMKDRRAIVIKNVSNVNIWLGNSGVTTADGYPILPYESLPIDCSMKLQWYGICAAGTAEIRYMEMSNV